jgi:hypothetical protein
MKIKFLILLIASSCFGLDSYSQGLKESSILVIGQFDRPDERYAVEVTLTELFSKQGLKAMPSLNILKQGSDPLVLASDTLQQLLLGKNIKTYLVVNVRGYDRRFKPSEIDVSLQEMLGRTSIYHIYREEATSVSLEFTFFRDNKVVFRDILRCGNISDRDSVLKRIQKKLPKRMSRKWSKN